MYEGILSWGWALLGHARNLFVQDPQVSEAICEHACSRLLYLLWDWGKWCSANPEAAPVPFIIPALWWLRMAHTSLHEDRVTAVFTRIMCPVEGKKLESRLQEINKNTVIGYPTFWNGIFSPLKIKSIKNHKEEWTGENIALSHTTEAVEYAAHMSYASFSGVMSPTSNRLAGVLAFWLRSQREESFKGWRCHGDERPGGYCCWDCV